MFKSYLITAVRNLFRNKTFSFIHIAGFTVGITCLIFIMKYVTYELSFDKFPRQADRIYRITGDGYAQTPVPLCSSEPFTRGGRGATYVSSSSEVLSVNLKYLE